MGDTIARTRFENVSKLSNDPLLARVLALENTKSAQAQEITSLKLRVKKLEKKGGLKTHKIKRLYKGRYGDDIMFDVSDLAGEEVFVAEQGVPDRKKADAEIAQESSSKRAGDELKQESIKKQNVDEDKETAKLKSLMEFILDEEEVSIDDVPLATKPPTIVDWKIHTGGKKSYYQIIRAYGSSKMYLVFSHMLKIFDREDLEILYKLVKSKYGSTIPVEDLDLVLYGDLKTMFDLHVEDQVWKSQSDYRVLEWKIYDSCGVHSLRKQNVHIHMLVEKRYPFTHATITDMLNKKLKADHWNEMCYQLLKLITKQLKNQ
ncbi:hypothetical protein Tco_0013644 [Tanacetum coccineum]